MATGSGSVFRRLLTSTSGQIRLTAATSFLLDIPSGQEALIVAASRGAADDLARDAARRRGASFGWHRFSLLQLAARLAMAELARRGRSPSSPLGAEAVAARAIFDVIENGELTYFSPVVRTPGFPRALARTLGELRLAGVPLARASSAGARRRRPGAPAGARRAPVCRCRRRRSRASSRYCCGGSHRRSARHGRVCHRPAAGAARSLADVYRGGAVRERARRVGALDSRDRADARCPFLRSTGARIGDARRTGERGVRRTTREAAHVAVRRAMFPQPRRRPTTSSSSPRQAKAGRPSRSRAAS